MCLPPPTKTSTVHYSNVACGGQFAEIFNFNTVLKYLPNLIINGSQRLWLVNICKSPAVGFGGGCCVPLKSLLFASLKGLSGEN
jgi:hypothetical protein